MANRQRRSGGGDQALREALQEILDYCELCLVANPPNAPRCSFPVLLRTHPYACADPQQLKDLGSFLARAADRGAWAPMWIALSTSVMLLRNQGFEMQRAIRQRSRPLLVEADGAARGLVAALRDGPADVLSAAASVADLATCEATVVRALLRADPQLARLALTKLELLLAADRSVVHRPEHRLGTAFSMLRVITHMCVVDQSLLAAPGLPARVVRAAAASAAAAGTQDATLHMVGGSLELLEMHLFHCEDVELSKLCFLIGDASGLIRAIEQHMEVVAEYADAALASRNARGARHAPPPEAAAEAQPSSAGAPNSLLFLTLTVIMVHYPKQLNSPAAAAWAEAAPRLAELSRRWEMGGRGLQSALLRTSGGGALKAFRTFHAKAAELAAEAGTLLRTEDGAGAGAGGVAHRCAVCSATRADGARLRRCRGCGDLTGVMYCGQACAREHWVKKGHRSLCERAQRTLVAMELTAHRLDPELRPARRGRSR